MKIKNKLYGSLNVFVRRGGGGFELFSPNSQKNYKIAPERGREKYYSAKIKTTQAFRLLCIRIDVNKELCIWRT